MPRNAKGAPLLPRVPLKYPREVRDGKWVPDWDIGFALTVHSSQGLTIHDPPKIWIIDDYLQWSNLAYLAVSRVEYLRQLERVVCPPEEGSEGVPTLKRAGAPQSHLGEAGGLQATGPGQGAQV